LGWIGRHRLAAIAEAEVAEIVPLADPEADFVLQASKLAPKARQMKTLEEYSKPQPMEWSWLRPARCMQHKQYHFLKEE
jgi:hypothetical protein